MRSINVLVVTLLLPSAVWAQQPVTNALVLHFDASDASTVRDPANAPATNGAYVQTWQDTSGMGRDASQPVAASQPRYSTNALNGLPVIRFDGSNDVLTNNVLTGFNVNNAMDSFVVGKIQSTGQNLGVFTMALGLQNDYSGLGIIVWNSGTAGQNSLYRNDTTLGNLLLPVQNYYIVEYARAAGQQGAKANGAMLSSIGQSTTTAISPDRFAIGSRILSGYAGNFCNCDVAEILFYTNGLSYMDRFRTTQYLARKYGLPNRVYAGDTAANGVYDQDIMGVGKELNDSTTNIAAAGLALLALNGSLYNNESVFAGHKAPANSYSTANLPSGVTQRWARVWYVDRTGSVDARLTFDFSDGGFGSFNGAVPYTLLYSPTSTLTFAAMALTPAVAGDQVAFDVPAASLADGYYTLGFGAPGVASNVAIVGLPVTTNLAVWLDAADPATVLDAGGVPATNGARVQTWADKSLNRKDGSAPSSSARPLFTTNVLNGNPVMTFDGSDDVIANAGPDELAMLGVDALVVGRYKTGVGTHKGLFNLCTGGSSDYQTGGVLVWNSGNLAPGADAAYDANNTGVSGLTVPVNSWYLYSFTQGASQHSVRTNGTVVGSGAQTPGAIYPDRYAVGSRLQPGVPSGWSPCEAAEVIVYKRALAAAQYRIVLNYLSSKYGLAISTNDVYAGDTPANGDYDSNVFGVGAEPDGAFTNGTVNNGLAIDALNGTLANGEYVLAGHKTASNSWKGNRWGRVWYVDVTGSVEARLTFDLGSTGAPPVEGGYRLFYASTPALAFDPVASPSSQSGTQVSFDLTGTALQDGYYTLGVYSRGVLLQVR